MALTHISLVSKISSNKQVISCNFWYLE